jgi:hypothetical protein
MIDLVVHLKGRVAEMLVHLSTMSTGRAAPIGRRATTLTTLRLRPTQGIVIDPPMMKVILAWSPFLGAHTPSFPSSRGMLGVPKRSFFQEVEAILIAT